MNNHSYGAGYHRGSTQNTTMFLEYDDDHDVVKQVIRRVKLVELKE